jgi:hypothetical protein
VTEASGGKSLAENTEPYYTTISNLMSALGNQIKVVLADMTENPVECPKKTAEMVFGHKETTYRKDSANRQPRDGCNLMYGPCGRENP